MNHFSSSGDESVVVVADPIDSSPPLDSLLAAARAGSTEAFCAAAQRCQARLYRQALALCRRDARWAGELAAEALVEAWRALARFDGSCQFSTWLYAILLRRYWKSLRVERGGRSAAEFPGGGVEAGLSGALPQVESAPGPDVQLRREESDARLLALVASLPIKHREVILLRFYEDASLLEIACALGISLGTVKSRLHHALEKLRVRPEVVNLFREWRDG